ncbi:MAG: UbiA family prenyltransferase [Deltaproteobacteria bacterium]|nr:UbiA family prenyltransferase [Deltaproteobacteria bacterium]
MSESGALNPSFSARLGLYFALSRPTHSVIDLASPFAAATLCLGRLPDWPIMLLGALTAFAGYTAVYALNDLMDFRIDRQRLAGEEGGQDSQGYLDAVLVRHPLAQGLVSLWEGLAWTAGWALVALIGAYLLNPVCALIFLAGAGLEAIYCLMLKVSHLRILVSGVVKTSGSLAAAYAVDPSPNPWFLLTVFLWIFFWELGGQNVPADWFDLEEDRRLAAKTLPLRYGPEKAGQLVLLSLVLSLGLGLVLLGLVTPAALPWPVLAAFVVAGLVLLIHPGWLLARHQNRPQAMVLFNRASFYPLVTFALVVLGIYL